MARRQILFSIHSSKGEFKNQHSTKKYQQQSEEVGDTLLINFVKRHTDISSLAPIPRYLTGHPLPDYSAYIGAIKLPIGHDVLAGCPEFTRSQPSAVSWHCPTQIKI
ncbi:hypothetical protein V9T40_007764 [Parthenolecanium corni]|uniref:Uncharacterized protein n=1 Tax=Parthenolecanium corni TaxID=536013 RepID=A0AAN9TJZ4_9HEMI